MQLMNSPCESLIESTYLFICQKCLYLVLYWYLSAINEQEVICLRNVNDIPTWIDIGIPLNYCIRKFNNTK